ncbi:sodium/proline symporter [Synergistaceae bacterium OttesenSCG-928-D05]|nr:sodium/proline symporter [Synergistaceae bacterium OttesenSCG-928-D05]
MDFSNNAQYITVFVLYFAIFIGFGVYQGKKVQNEEDYAIGGRDIPGWAAALSERATGESSWALLGLPGWAYVSGMSCFWVLFGCFIGIAISWAILAFRIRALAEEEDALSFVDLISKLHPSMDGYIRTAGSLVIVFFFFFYIGAQLLGGGKVFNTLFGLSSDVGMLLTVLIIVPYTVYGGFKSVIYTDCIQGFLMVCALALAPILGFFLLESKPDIFAPGVFAALAKAGPEYLNIMGSGEGWAMFAGVMGGFAYFFGYLGGTPQLTMRFMAIKDYKNTIKGRNIGIIWTLVAYFGACSIGWLGIALWGPTGLTDPEAVFPMVMLEFFHPALAALFIVAAFAALISTADSLLVLASTEFSENIMKRFFSKEHNPKKDLFFSRCMTAVMAVLALGAAKVVPSNLIFNIVGYVWSGIGNPFSVIILLTLFWRRFSSKAAFAVICTGMPFTIFWIMSGLDTKIISSLFMTFFVCLIVGVVGSFIWPQRNEVPDRELVFLNKETATNTKTATSKA